MDEHLSALLSSSSITSLVGRGGVDEGAERSRCCGRSDAKTKGSRVRVAKRARDGTEGLYNKRKLIERATTEAATTRGVYYELQAGTKPLATVAA